VVSDRVKNRVIHGKPHGKPGQAGQVGTRTVAPMLAKKICAD